MENNNQVDDIIMDWFPNCNDMLKTTLGNPNMIYYPINSNESNLKAFDFVTSKTHLGDEDDFISIDKELLGKQKTSSKAKKDYPSQR